MSSMCKQTYVSQVFDSSTLTWQVPCPKTITLTLLSWILQAGLSIILDCVVIFMACYHREPCLSCSLFMLNSCRWRRYGCLQFHSTLGQLGSHSNCIGNNQTQANIRKREENIVGSLGGLCYEQITNKNQWSESDDVLSMYLQNHRHITIPIGVDIWPLI